MKRIIATLVSFVPRQMRPQIRELYVSTVIMNFGVLMVLIFEPIYLYTLGYGLGHIALFFSIVYVVYFFIMPFGAHIAKEFGYEHSIYLSTFAFIAYYAVFYFIRDVPLFFYLAALLYAIQKTLYWPAYHADFARFANRAEDAREVGGIDAVVLLVNIIAPFLGGVLLKFFGFSVLFTVISVIILLSNVPLLITREVFVPKPFPYLLAYQNLLKPENRKLVVSYLGYAEELIALVIWPIFMISLVKDFLGLGSIVAFAAFVTALFSLYVGRRSDFRSKRSMLITGTFVYSLLWFQRAFVTRPIGVLFSDTLGRIGKEMVSVPIVSLTYEDAQSHSVMQTVILFEMSLVVGKLLALGLVVFLLFALPEEYLYAAIFGLAGVMTLFYAVRAYVR